MLSSILRVGTVFSCAMLSSILRVGTVFSCAWLLPIQQCDHAMGSTREGIHLTYALPLVWPSGLWQVGQYAAL